jgi:L-histidine N-alpha-methyltransferase
MNFTEPVSYSESQITIDNLLPAIGKHKIINSILNGLAEDTKQISSMFFYDERGSKLFEKITKLPEYYLTRTEKKLLNQLSDTICNSLCDMDIIELGSGDCSKISILFNASSPSNRESIRYIPVDVSLETIKQSADILAAKYTELTIHGIVADFITQLHAIPLREKRLFCFLGSTLGNLTENQRSELFAGLGNLMHDNDVFLLGIDMVKPKNILEQAYNDSAKVTAEFNRNILNVINSLIGTNFDPNMFEHVAFYNEQHSRIEMHLKALKDMTISCPHLPYKINITKGELIHTENSHKFTLSQIAGQIKKAGLNIDTITTDPKRWFSLIQLTKGR